MRAETRWLAVSTSPRWRCGSRSQTGMWWWWWWCRRSGGVSLIEATYKRRHFPPIKRTTSDASGGEPSATSATPINEKIAAITPETDPLKASQSGSFARHRVLSDGRESGGASLVLFVVLTSFALTQMFMRFGALKCTHDYAVMQNKQYMKDKCRGIKIACTLVTKQN